MNIIKFKFRILYEVVKLTDVDQSYGSSLRFTSTKFHVIHSPRVYAQ
jgi:hypothetical protein